MMGQTEEKSSSIQRAIRVVRAVLRTDGKWFSLTIMSHKTGLTPNTLLRYMDALIDEGWLEKNDRAKYRLTKDILSLLVIQGLKAIRTSEGV